MKKIKFFTLNIFLLFFAASAASGSKISADLENHLNLYSTAKVWIYFKDKGPEENTLLSKPDKLISERAIERRLKMKPEHQVIDHSKFFFICNNISMFNVGNDWD